MSNDDTSTDGGRTAQFEGAPGVGDIIDVIGRIPGLVDPDDGVIVEVVNETNVPLVRTHQSEDTSFKTLPKQTIEPGERDVFVTGEQTGSVLSGAEGAVTYQVGDPQTTWTIRWENPNLIGDNAATSLVQPETGVFDTTEEIADVGGFAPARFTIAGDHPRPGAGGRQLAARVVVVNTTRHELVRDEFGHTEGEFRGATPAPTVEPEDDTQFVTASDDEDPEGAAGYVRWQLREDTPDFWWDVTWFVPVEGQVQVEVAHHGGRADEFTSTAVVTNPDPNDLELRFELHQVAGPVDPVEPVEFEFPTHEADEPTLRQGMRGEDGWVEYLQSLLNYWGMGVIGDEEHPAPTLAALVPIAEDGDFGNGTRRAVVAFQTDRGLMVDGICGNQTWSELKEEPPRQPGTDGRAPGTYEEIGAEARWVTDRAAVASEPHPEDANAFVAWAANVGDVELRPDDFQAYARATDQDTGVSYERLLEIESWDGAIVPGSEFGFVDRGFREHVGAGTYHVEVIMPQELGGDRAEGPFEMGSD